MLLALVCPGIIYRNVCEVFDNVCNAWEYDLICYQLWYDLATVIGTCVKCLGMCTLLGNDLICYQLWHDLAPFIGTLVKSLIMCVLLGNTI